MTKENTISFAVPPTIEQSLTCVRSYWEGLRRGENSVPFWDDVDLSSLASLADDVLLLDAFDSPWRFRFALVGKRVAAEYGGSLTGKFLDELEQRAPLKELDAQCSFAAEHRTPAYSSSGGISRLVLPLWGEGRVSMLLVATAE